MKYSFWNRAVNIVAAVTAIVAVTGCASTQPSKPTTRYLGYSEAVSQGETRLYAGGSLEEQGHVAAAAALQANHKSSYVMTTTVLLAGRGNAIIRREFPVSGFQESFGRETEVLFSIQPCNRLGVENGHIVCTDHSAEAPVVIPTRLLLRGGQKVAVQFPGNVVWTYQVLDQASPLIEN
jgi:hypothetical protein